MGAEGMAKLQASSKLFFAAALALEPLLEPKPIKQTIQHK